MTPVPTECRAPAPAPVDAEQVAAELKNGVLLVKLPKREEVKPRRVQVKVD